MGHQNGDENHRPCPNCGSSYAEALEINEHERCGAIKPLDEFRTDDGYVCPDCDVECGTEELSSVQRGAIVTCLACGKRYDRTATPTASDVQPADSSFFDQHSIPSFDTANRRNGARLSLPFGGRWIRSDVTVLLMVFIVSSAVVTAVGSAPLLERQSNAAGEWQEYQSIVVFRNDDIQPHYRTEEMRAVDEVFVEEGVPVTQGVIPVNRNTSLERDQQLCQYLRNQHSENSETFEFALHGYRHQKVTSFHSGSEFGAVDADTQRRWIQHGTDILASCTDQRPTTFIPPMDTYDNSTVRALAQANYTVVSGGGWFTDKYYGKTQPFESNGLLHAPNTQSFVRNWSTNEFYSQRALERRFDAAYENESLYMQMLHYPTFTDEERLQTLRGLINHMQSKEGVRFMTVGEFASKYHANELRRVDDGWEIWQSNETEQTTLNDRISGWAKSLTGSVPLEARPGAGFDPAPATHLQFRTQEGS